MANVRREVEYLDGSHLDIRHSTCSWGLRTHVDEFRKFARWNSSLLGIIGFMIVMVSCSGAAYLLFNRDTSPDPHRKFHAAIMAQNNNKNCKKISSNLIGTEIGTGVCNHYFDRISFPSQTGTQLKMCVNKDDDETVSLLLDATGGQEMSLWESWDLDCKYAVTQLKLMGPFSYNDLLNFQNLFGKTTHKLVVNGPAICNSINNEEELNPIIFDSVSHLTFFNMTRNCDKLIDSFIRGTKQDGSLTVEFNHVVVNQRIEKIVANLLATGKVSTMLMYDLQYHY